MAELSPSAIGDARERALIEAAQRDSSCFAELYDAYFARIYAFISRRVFNRADAEDLTSEVFHQALSSLPRFEWRGIPFAAWLYRIAANTIADHSVRLAREGRVPEVDDPAEGELSQIDNQLQIQRLLDELSEDHRKVLLLRFAEEKSTSEIARQLGRTEGAVKQLQFRALKTLRERLDKEQKTQERRRTDG